MLFPALLLLGTLLLAAFIITMIVPVRRAVAVGCATNLLQIYTFPVLGIYVSLSQLAWLSAWRAPFSKVALWRWSWMQALALLLALRVASIAWSPNKILGVRYLIYSIPLVFVAHAIYSMTKERPRAAYKCIQMLLIASTVEAVLTMIFRVSPALEFAFLRSFVARLFVGSNSLQAFFTTSPDNVFDPSKAGGVFLNANVAALFLGVCAMAAWGYSSLTASVSLRLVAVLDWVAVFFSGSKAGAIFGVLVPLAAGILVIGRGKRVSLKAAVLLCLGLGAAALGVVLVWRFNLMARFTHDSLDTLGSREAVWGFARQMLPQHPLLGLGFGGWEQKFPLYAVQHDVNPTFPPHNSLLLMWSQSGLVALAAGLLWVALVYGGIVQGLRKPGLQQLAVGIGAAFTWYLLQGLGENIGLVGEAHLTPLVGALLGNFCALYDSLETPDEPQPESVRGPATPPVVFEV